MSFSYAMPSARIPSHKGSFRSSSLLFRCVPRRIIHEREVLVPQLVRVGLLQQKTVLSEEEILAQVGIRFTNFGARVFEMVDADGILGVVSNVVPETVKVVIRRGVGDGFRSAPVPARTPAPVLSFERAFTVWDHLVACVDFLETVGTQEWCVSNRDEALKRRTDAIRQRGIER